MRIPFSFLEKNTTAANLAAVGLVAVAVVATGGPIFPYITQGINTVFKSPFVRLRETVTDLYAVREENVRLQEILAQASVSLSELKSQKAENERLRVQLSYPPPEGHRLIPIEPVSVTYHGVPVAIEVNKGVEADLAVGQPVISNRGLVGRISAVTQFASTVQLLTDPRCRVSGRVEESRELGILRYRPSLGLLLDNVALDGQVKSGDLIVTSGLGGVFPEGLRVGVVERVARGKERMFAEVIVRPTVNFNAIDEIFAVASTSSDWVVER